MRIVFYCPDFYCPAVIGFAASLVEEIKEILLPSPCEAISAISAISAGLKTCQLVGFVLLSQRNEGNKGNSLTRPTREAFLLFLLFLRDNKFGGTLMSYIFTRDVPYLNQRCPISQPEMSYIVKQDVLYR